MDNKIQRSLSSVLSESAYGSSAESMSPLSPSSPASEVFASASAPSATQSDGHSQRPLLVEMEDALMDLVDWEGVAIQLEFSSASIEIIRRDHRFSTPDQKRQMIMDWLRKDPNASMEKLREALMKSKQFVLAEKIQVSHQIVTNQDGQYAKMRCYNEDKVKDHFAGLLIQILSALDSEGVSVDDVHVYLNEICECDVPKTNFVEMFKVIKVNNRWSYYNYSPLEYFVKRFLPGREFEKLVAEYKKIFSGFCTTVKLVDYIRSANLPINEDDDDLNELPLTAYKPHFRKLKTKLKLERKISELSLKYVQDIWVQFAEEFDLPFLTAVLDRILEGCLEIIWLILSHVAAIIANSAHKSVSFFHKNHIIYVAIDDHPVYDASLTEQLFEAASQGTWQRVKSLLQNKDEMLNLNFVNQDGKSLLIVASEGGHELVLLLLLDNGVDIDFKQEANGWTALFFAAENGHDVATSLLLAYGADPHQMDEAGETAHSIAEKKGNKQVCEELRSLGSKKKPAVKSISTQQAIKEKLEGAGVYVFGRIYQFYYQMTSNLIGAARSDNLDAVKYILEYGRNVDINATESDKHGWTALMWATEGGNFETVELLLERGADPNAVAKDSEWSPLMLSSRRGYLRIAKSLLDHGAVVNHQNFDGVSSLAVALYERHSAVALLLIHKGADIDLPAENGWNPLIRASNEGNLKLVKVIADLGANINSQTEEGWSALMVASHYGHVDVVRELGERGAILNMSTNAGDTALHIAALRNHPAIVKLLAQFKADLDISNKDGLTALMVATNKGHEEVIKALKDGDAKDISPQGAGFTPTINDVDRFVSALEERFSGLIKQYDLEKTLQHGIGARIYRWLGDTWLSG